MVELSASKPVGGGGAVPFSTEIVRLPASGAVATVIVGTLCGSKGSDPLAASTTSGNPSPSLSAVGFGSTTVNSLLCVSPEVELPKELVATKGNVSDGVPTLMLKFAEVPDRSIDTAVMVITGVWNEKVALARFAPVTVKVGMTALKRAECRLIAVMTGTGVIVKLLVDCTVVAPTVTEI